MIYRTTMILVYRKDECRFETGSMVHGVLSNGAMIINLDLVTHGNLAATSPLVISTEASHRLCCCEVNMWTMWTLFIKMCFGFG